MLQLKHQRRCVIVMVGCRNSVREANGALPSHPSVAFSPVPRDVQVEKNTLLFLIALMIPVLPCVIRVEW